MRPHSMWRLCLADHTVSRPVAHQDTARGASRPPLARAGVAVAGGLGVFVGVGSGGVGEGAIEVAVAVSWETAGVAVPMPGTVNGIGEAVAPTRLTGSAPVAVDV